MEPGNAFKYLKLRKISNHISVYHAKSTNIHIYIQQVTSISPHLDPPPKVHAASVSFVVSPLTVPEAGDNV